MSTAQAERSRDRLGCQDQGRRIITLFSWVRGWVETLRIRATIDNRVRFRKQTHQLHYSISESSWFALKNT